MFFEADFDQLIVDYFSDSTTLLALKENVEKKSKIKPKGIKNEFKNLYFVCLMS